MKNIFLNYFNIFFIVIFFPSFVTGVFLPNFIYFLFISINILFNFHKIKLLIFTYKNISIMFIIFYLLLLTSSFLSNYIIHSLNSSLLYFTYIIYVAAIIILFFEKKFYRILFLICGVISFFIISLDGLYELVNDENLLGYYAFEGRIAGLFNERWVVGRYLTFFLPILFGVFLIEINSFNKTFKLFSISTFLLSILVVFFSGERAAFLSMILYLVFLIFYFIRKISFSKIIASTSFLIIFVITPFTFSETNKRLQDNFIKYLTNYDVNENQYYAMGSTAFKIFIDKPLIGAGPNNFRYSCSEDVYNISKYSCSTHPHNIPIQLLAETGILSFLIFYSVFIYFLIKSVILIKEKKFNNFSLGIYSIQCSIIIYFWPIMISGNFFLSWYGFIFYLPIGMYLMYIKENKT